jgi:hypothetical protein
MVLQLCYRIHDINRRNCGIAVYFNDIRFLHITSLTEELLTGALQLRLAAESDDVTGSPELFVTPDVTAAATRLELTALALTFARPCELCDDDSLIRIISRPMKVCEMLITVAN